MAKTQDFIGSDLRVQKWELGAAKALLLDPAFARMLNRGTLYVSPEGEGKDVGDTINMAYNKPPTSPGVGEGGVLDGNEEVLDYEKARMSLNMHRKAFLIEGERNIARFRTNLDFDFDAYDNIVRYFTAVIDTCCFQQLAGAFPTVITSDEIDFTGDLRYLVTGNNTVDALHADRHLYAGGVSADEDITSTDTMRLDYIDVALEKARKSPYIKPHSDGRYDLYMSVEQANDLKTDSKGKIQFYEIAQSEIQSGKKTIFNDGRGIEAVTPFGVYDRVNLIMCDRVAYGVHSSTSVPVTNVKRAVFTGQKALQFASPTITTGDLKKLKPEKNGMPLKIIKENKDYEDKLGIASSMIYGLKRKKFDNTRDTGVIAISTYSAPHTI